MHQSRHVLPAASVFIQVGKSFLLLQDVDFVACKAEAKAVKLKLKNHKHSSHVKPQAQIVWRIQHCCHAVTELASIMLCVTWACKPCTVWDAQVTMIVKAAFKAHQALPHLKCKMVLSTHALYKTTLNIHKGVQACCYACIARDVCYMWAWTDHSGLPLEPFFFFPL
jgi:hypothetical protein